MMCVWAIKGDYRHLMVNFGSKCKTTDIELWAYTLCWIFILITKLQTECINGIKDPFIVILYAFFYHSSM